MSGSIFKDGYTEAERDQISELIDSIPGQYYGEHGDWEETVLNLTKIIRAKMRRQLVQRHTEELQAVLMQTLADAFSEPEVTTDEPITITIIRSESDA